MKSGLPLTLAAISIGAISLGLIWEGTNKSRDDSKNQKSQQSSHSHYSSGREHMSYGQSRHKRAKFNAVDRLEKLYENYPEVAIDLNFNGINLNAAIASLFPSNREDQKYTDLETCALKLNSDEAYDIELLASVIESHRQELDTLLQLESFHVPPDDSIKPSSYRKASRLLQVYLAHSILNDSFEEASKANNILKGITNELARAPLMGHSVAIAGNLEQNAIIHRMSLKFPALTNELSAYLDTQLNSSHFRECMKSETAAINQLLYNYTNLGEDGSLYLSSAELYDGSEDGRIPLDLFEQAATEIMLNSIAIVDCLISSSVAKKTYRSLKDTQRPTSVNNTRIGIHSILI